MWSTRRSPTTARAGATASGASGSAGSTTCGSPMISRTPPTPPAVLFLNDYNLETNPKKRATFLGLAEALLKAGAPLGGLGTQTHVAADLAPGAITDDAEGPRQPRPEGAGLGDGRLSRPHAWFGSFNRRLESPPSSDLPRGCRSVHGLAPAPTGRLHVLGPQRLSVLAKANERLGRTPLVQRPGPSEVRRRGVGGRLKAHALGLCRGSRAGRNARSGPGEGPGAVW